LATFSAKAQTSGEGLMASTNLNLSKSAFSEQWACVVGYLSAAPSSVALTAPIEAAATHVRMVLGSSQSVNASLDASLDIFALGGVSKNTSWPIYASLASGPGSAGGLTWQLNPKLKTQVVFISEPDGATGSLQANSYSFIKDPDPNSATPAWHDLSLEFRYGFSESTYTQESGTYGYDQGMNCGD
jgi:hypothetical protein